MLFSFYSYERQQKCAALCHFTVKLFVFQGNKRCYCTKSRAFKISMLFVCCFKKKIIFFEFPLHLLLVIDCRFIPNKDEIRRERKLNNLLLNNINNNKIFTQSQKAKLDIEARKYGTKFLSFLFHFLIM